jgi:hypothetical protein
MYNSNNSNLRYIKTIANLIFIEPEYGVSCCGTDDIYNSKIDGSYICGYYRGTMCLQDTGYLLPNIISKFKLTEIQNHTNNPLQRSNIGFNKESYSWFAITKDTLKVFSCDWNIERKEIVLLEVKEWLNSIRFDEKR